SRKCEKNALSKKSIFFKFLISIMASFIMTPPTIPVTAICDFYSNTVQRCMNKIFLWFYKI
ncbi:hypothetical protein, partial [Staphylococcus pseudintermedius]|uniref:hypothetical protein n=1 Tax=Staphylococcus pseudintermedius TaxID=283734 RepID=UPI0036F39530